MAGPSARLVFLLSLNGLLWEDLDGILAIDIASSAPNCRYGDGVPDGVSGCQ